MKQRHVVHRSSKMFLHLYKKVLPEAGVVCRICAKNVEIVRKLCRDERRTPQCVAGRVLVAVAACKPNDMGLQTATLVSQQSGACPLLVKRLSPQLPDSQSDLSDPQGCRHRRPWLRFMALLSAHALSLLGFGGLMERQGRTSLLCVDRCEKAAALLNVETEMPQRRTMIHAAQQETRNGLQ